MMVRPEKIGSANFTGSRTTGPIREFVVPLAGCAMILGAGYKAILAFLADRRAARNRIQLHMSFTSSSSPIELRLIGIGSAQLWMTFELDRALPKEAHPTIKVERVNSVSEPADSFAIDASELGKHTLSFTGSGNPGWATAFQISAANVDAFEPLELLVTVLPRGESEFHLEHKAG